MNATFARGALALAFGLLLTHAALAQEIVGHWRGLLVTPAGNLRIGVPFGEVATTPFRSLDSATLPESPLRYGGNPMTSPPPSGALDVLELMRAATLPRLR